MKRNLINVICCKTLSNQSGVTMNKTVQCVSFESFMNTLFSLFLFIFSFTEKDAFTPGPQSVSILRLVKLL